MNPIAPALAAVSVAPAGARGDVADLLAERLEAIAALERRIRSAQAEQLRLVRLAHEAMFAFEGIRGDSTGSERELATRSFLAELATTLVVHERTASRLLGDAERLVDLPSTESAFSAGAVSLTQVRSAIEFTTGAAPEVVVALDSATAERAPHQTNTQLRRVLRRLRERLDPVPLEERRELAAAERRVCIEPARDGMAWLSILLPAERAIAVQSRLDALADRTLADDPDEPRTRAQLGADLAAELLLSEALDGTSATSPTGSVAPRVLVTVPVLTLLGLGDEPADLDGYGPIDAETARRLAAHAPSFTRILTHPETGAFLSYDRTTYRVPADLAGYLAVRDGGCRFPGCGRRAARCDLDHTTAWADGGPTSHANLAHLCRKHHRLKHETRWRMTQEPGGVIRWDSPAGRAIRSEPERPFAGIAGMTGALVEPAA
ncbi:HNH endonuclease [Agromyces seonyuensis]|uniref:DUF222 domain-containing protein n=1 Tax=Agromyces seonyuensis TaxID=2662446 RepID=A0A6I4NWY7_9MICO|nr:HNH endonuclease signature motif containing protein [Agromyces seonyuensis]MWB98691.1 DUF222 domain-containing protein [Agromyces seonyuensis]